ncbi:MAG: VOC family protein [Candidatus Cloacimonetes bacterium]|nr:VOC family protein [Candidatus Cloacimonadota bacterium]
MNKFCHIEIPAPDLEKTVKFYTDVFDWEVEVLKNGNYAFFKDGLVGGGFDPDMKVSKGGPNLVIECDDIPTKMAEIIAAGGKQTLPKTEIGDDMGFYASFLDVNGNRLSIWSKN